MMSSALLTGLVVVVAVGVFALSEERWLRDRRVLWSARALVAGSVLLGAWVLVAVAGQPRPVGEADLVPGSVMAVPATTARLSLLVSVDAGPVDAKSSRMEEYVFRVSKGGEVVARKGVELQRYVAHGRRRRRHVVSQLEHRVDLPREARGQELTVELADREGNIDAPIHVAAVRAPPALGAVIAGALMLTAAGAWLDARSRRRTHYAMTVGFLGAFAVLSLDGVTPHAARGAIMGGVVAALLFGALPGALVRWLAGRASDRPATVG